MKDIVRVDAKRRVQVKGIHYPVGAYKVLGIKDSNEIISDILDRQGNGFSMHPITYDPEVDTELYRSGLESALEEALRILRKEED